MFFNVVDLPWVYLIIQKLDNELSENFASNIRQIWNYSILLNLVSIRSCIDKPSVFVRIGGKGDDDGERGFENSRGGEGTKSEQVQTKM